MSEMVILSELMSCDKTIHDWSNTILTLLLALFPTGIISDICFSIKPISHCIRYTYLFNFHIILTLQVQTTRLQAPYPSRCVNMTTKQAGKVNVYAEKYGVGHTMAVSLLI